MIISDRLWNITHTWIMRTMRFSYFLTARRMNAFRIQRFYKIDGFTELMGNLIWVVERISAVSSVLHIRLMNLAAPLLNRNSLKGGSGALEDKLFLSKII